ncbi:hypothetical protein [Jatrophihabitans endophyticus]|uniref:hypothetical protein n=1 Tax=Jatrophihabitans endophyticus TaxID=1206085 RepID=UPI0019E08FB2|nr:hypothetical protein [Jatrophihabitans endophyticus]MBE7186909.1 hypothetical protein [Jatrophihabitans endophyticus]
MADDLARQLLEAQTAWVVAELTGPRLDDLLAHDVADLMALAGELTLAEVADPAQVKTSARRLAALVIGSEALAGLVPAVADAVHDAPAADEHLLGDVVGREHVDALVARALELHRLEDRVMERLAESPLVATIAQRYVTKLVGDFLQANREQAEKLPGVSTMFSVGLGAASRVRGAADKRLGGLLGDAQNRSTQFAIKRSNGALREILRDAPVHDAAMELWDLQAAEPVAALREYLTAADLRDLLSIVHAAVVDASGHEYVGALIDAGVDVVFERWGSTDLAAVLADLGLTADVLLDDLRRFAPPLLEAAARDGRLAELVRTRLAPFFELESTRALLDGATPPRARPRPPRA